MSTSLLGTPVTPARVAVSAATASLSATKAEGSFADMSMVPWTVNSTLSVVVVDEVPVVVEDDVVEVAEVELTVMEDVVLAVDVLVLEVAVIDEEVDEVEVVSVAEKVVVVVVVRRMHVG
mmetsp:Transcript_120439/g.312678  ORF Transcript_120439/g.312678 Transcript_120439/m.312678 type:complete len:120 (+) Transcript_120439:760-1119(+)